MPTDPHKDILYREFAVVQARDLFPKAAPLLREIINFGTNAFVRCMSVGGSEENVDLAPFALYRHILELTDSIEVMVENGCPAAATPNLRSAFEGLLALEYIMENPTDYRIRSLCWLATYIRRRLRSYRTLLASSSEGKEFLKSIEEDKTIHEFPSLPQEKITAAIANLESLLSKDQFQEIQNAFIRYKREPHWYQLFSGPSNLYELARHLRRPAQYDVLYREWSTSSHAVDFSPFLAPSPSGQSGIRGLRDVASTNHVTTFAATFLLDATRVLIDKFHPGEMWGNWYMREVRDPLVTTARAIHRR